MKVMTIKEFAEDQKVSYEAIRKQLIRYQKELKDHISVTGRTQYLDEWAVDFLRKRRREQPIILLSQDKDEEIESLKAQVESLKVQLLTAQQELLNEKDRVINLQEASRKGLEAQVKYSALLEDNNAKEEKLKEVTAQAETLRTEADGLRRQAEEDRKRIEDLQKERDEARTEAGSYTRSLFGFYRKK